MGKPFSETAFFPGNRIFRGDSVSDTTAAESIDAAVRAGVAIFNSGRYHEAHDAWEEHWLTLPSGTDDERFLHGLIQYTAAVYHALNENEEGARGLATSAREYLWSLPGSWRDVSLVPVRHRLAAIAVDPGVVRRRSVGRLTYRGTAIELGELGWPSTGIVAAVIAEESELWDPAVIEAARSQASRDGRIRALVADFARDETNRSVIYDRLTARVEREQARDQAVDDLFEDNQ